ncbi:DnaJ domain-containing protein [Solirubrobacter sp. CPCC 204708]|uniref:DnaJ domain-containing protein n=1 Tax=Solirubrobacter deserti TaxID=2282478 RepID=A0ABT4RG77_9ACTN|nr:DnaJ domain-containing protein [Solirubrobacter deserti]MBE2319722.1 DnaJ domain-containing protein [Solirubrobacter deserti]MDA0137538.1 DnaJ domain-containing protein [Solirubrobacter deserti]
MPRDPYRVLGVPSTASSEELHDAYRRLVKLHHPDRNGGSEESARRFAEVQEAYEAVRSRPRAARPQQRAADAADAVKERMVKLERELREAQAARERARQAARDAVRDGEPEPRVAETDDSIAKILGDLRDEVSGKVAQGLRHPAVKRVGDLIDDAISRVDRR